MTVYVQRKRCCGVAEIALNGLDVISCPDSSNCVAVSQIVKTGVGTANGCHDPFVFPVNGGLRQMMTGLVCKYQITLLPRRASVQLLLILLLPTRLQLRHDERGGGDGSGSAVLGGNQLIGINTFFLMKLQLFINQNRSAGEVDTIPSQPKQLSLPHAGKQGDKEEGFKSIPLDRFEKR